MTCAHHITHWGPCVVSVSRLRVDGKSCWWRGKGAAEFISAGPEINSFPITCLEIPGKRSGIEDSLPSFLLKHFGCLRYKWVRSRSADNHLCLASVMTPLISCQLNKPTERNMFWHPVVHDSQWNLCHIRIPKQQTRNAVCLAIDIPKDREKMISLRGSHHRYLKREKLVLPHITLHFGIPTHLLWPASEAHQ